MTNPNNALGTNAAYNGRTSVNAVNDVLATLSGRGVLSGWAIRPASGLSVVLGGEPSVRDVAVAEDNAGNRTTINNISGTPVTVTLPAADPENPRVDAIVAYVNNPAVVDPLDYIIDSPEICGLIVVSNPDVVMPDDAKIRQAITADGADGTKAYYVVLGSVFIGAAAETIPDKDITQGETTTADNDDTVKGYETVIIDAGDWTDATDEYSPYTSYTVKELDRELDSKSVVTLINDQAVLFANYGFAIFSVDGQRVFILALEKPETAVALTFEIKARGADVLDTLRRLNSGTGAE